VAFTGEVRAGGWCRVVHYHSLGLKKPLLMLGIMTKKPLRMCSATAVTDGMVMRIDKKGTMSVIHRQSPENTQLAPSEQKSLLKSAGWKGGDSGDSAGETLSNGFARKGEWAGTEATVRCSTD
jgi:hypothetical protein